MTACSILKIVKNFLLGVAHLTESLLSVRHGQEPPDGQEIGSGVHQDEEEHAGGVERGELGVILHDVVHLLLKNYEVI